MTVAVMRKQAEKALLRAADEGEEGGEFIERAKEILWLGKSKGSLVVSRWL